MFCRHALVKLMFVACVIFLMQKGRVVHANPISWISPEDNSDYDGSDDNNDAAIITTPTKRVNLISLQILIFLHSNIF